MRWFALIVAVAVALAGCSTPDRDVLDDAAGLHKSRFTGPFPQDFPIHGIDVSKYQGKVDWRAVRAAGVKFAWIKATEGADHLDPEFRRNWFEAKAAGVPRGAYHFVYWCRPWQQQMAWFEHNVPVEPEALPPVLDVEATPHSRTCKRVLHRDDVLPEIANMLAELERHYGKRPIIYTSVDFYHAILQPHAFSNYPIWIRSTKYSPPVEYGHRKWHFWQYRSDGSVPGIAGKVDRNVFFGNARQWVAWLDHLKKGYEHFAARHAVVTSQEPFLEAMQTLPATAK